MYGQCLPYQYAARYPPMGAMGGMGARDRRRVATKETLWRLSWPYVFTLILASLMILFIVAIFILEIASLATDRSNNLSNTASTGAGIWCSAIFIIPVIFMFLFVLVHKNSRTWATYTLITHIIATVFMFILIALDANAVTPYNTMITTAPIKIQILKGQLALAILMLLFPIGFLSAYIYTAFKSLYPFRLNQSGQPPYSIPPYPTSPYPTAPYPRVPYPIPPTFVRY